jgi:hypothetical protein
VFGSTFRNGLYAKFETPSSLHLRHNLHTDGSQRAQAALGWLSEVPTEDDDGLGVGCGWHAEVERRDVVLTFEAHCCTAAD